MDDLHCPMLDVEAAYTRALNAYRKEATRHNDAAECYLRRAIDDAEFLASLARLNAASDALDIAERALQDYADAGGVLTAYL